MSEHDARRVDTELTLEMLETEEKSVSELALDDPYLSIGVAIEFYRCILAAARAHLEAKSLLQKGYAFLPQQREEMLEAEERCKECGSVYLADQPLQGESDGC